MPITRDQKHDDLAWHCSLSTLPPEILLHIIQNLPPRDIRTLTIVGSRMLRVCALSKYRVSSSQPVSLVEPFGTQPRDLIPFLRRVRSTPTLAKCISHLYILYDPYFDILEFPAPEAPMRMTWGWRQDQTPAEKTEMLTHSRRSMVELLRLLPRLEMLDLGQTKSEAEYRSRSSSKAKRERILWHIACVVPFPGAIAVPVSERNNYDHSKCQTAIRSRSKLTGNTLDVSHYLVSAQQLSAGAQYLTNLKKISHISTKGYVSLLSILPALFCPQITHVCLRYANEDEDPISIKQWLCDSAKLANTEGSGRAYNEQEWYERISPLKSLYLQQCWFTKTTLETLLRLTHSLREFSFSHMSLCLETPIEILEAPATTYTHSNDRVLSPWVILDLLQASAGESLESLELQYPLSQANIIIGSPNFPQLGCRSLLGFRRLKSVTIPLWILRGGKEWDTTSKSELESLFQYLPESIQQVTFVSLISRLVTAEPTSHPDWLTSLANLVYNLILHKTHGSTDPQSEVNTPSSPSDHELKNLKSVRIDFQDFGFQTNPLSPPLNSLWRAIWRARYTLLERELRENIAWGEVYDVVGAGGVVVQVKSGLQNEWVGLREVLGLKIVYE